VFLVKYSAAEMPGISHFLQYQPMVYSQLMPCTLHHGTILPPCLWTLDGIWINSIRVPCRSMGLTRLRQNYTSRKSGNQQWTSRIT